MSNPLLLKITFSIHDDGYSITYQGPLVDDEVRSECQGLMDALLLICEEADHPVVQEQRHSDSKAFAERFPTPAELLAERYRTNQTSNIDQTPS